MKNLQAYLLCKVHRMLNQGEERPSWRERRCTCNERNRKENPSSTGKESRPNPGENHGSMKQGAGWVVRTAQACANSKAALDQADDGFKWRHHFAWLPRSHLRELVDSTRNWNRKILPRDKAAAICGRSSSDYSKATRNDSISLFKYVHLSSGSRLV